MLLKWGWSEDIHVTISIVIPIPSFSSLYFFFFSFPVIWKHLSYQTPRSLLFRMHEIKHGIPTRNLCPTNFRLGSSTAKQPRHGNSMWIKHILWILPKCLKRQTSGRIPTQTTERIIVTELRNKQRKCRNWCRKHLVIKFQNGSQKYNMDSRTGQQEMQASYDIIPKKASEKTKKN